MNEIPENPAIKSTLKEKNKRNYKPNFTTGKDLNFKNNKDDGITHRFVKASTIDRIGTILLVVFLLAGIVVAITSSSNAYGETNVPILFLILSITVVSSIIIFVVFRILAEIVYQLQKMNSKK